LSFLVCTNSIKVPTTFAKYSSDNLLSSDGICPWRGL
jgi:hypothetical protein